MCGWYWPPAVSFSRICAATVLEAQAPDGAEGLYGYGAEDVVKEFERYERLKKVSWRLGQGNEEFTFVREGNALASRCVLFIHLATAIGAIWLLEQPGQSILLSYYRINDIWRTVTGFRKKVLDGQVFRAYSQASHGSVEPFGVCPRNCRWDVIWNNGLGSRLFCNIFEPSRV